MEASHDEEGKDTGADKDEIVLGPADPIYDIWRPSYPVKESKFYLLYPFHGPLHIVIAM